jgi:hypothetical protein
MQTSRGRVAIMGAGGTNVLAAVSRPRSSQWGLRAEGSHGDRDGGRGARRSHNLAAGAATGALPIRPYTLNPESSTLNPEPGTLNPQH